MPRGINGRRGIDWRPKLKLQNAIWRASQAVFGLNAAPVLDFVHLFSLPPPSSPALRKVCLLTQERTGCIGIPRQFRTPKRGI